MPEQGHWLGEDQPTETDADAMEALGVANVRRLRRLITSGRLEAVHVGTERRYTRRAIRECIRRCTVSNAPTF